MWWLLEGGETSKSERTCGGTGGKKHIYLQITLHYIAKLPCKIAFTKMLANLFFVKNHNIEFNENSFCYSRDVS